MATDCKSVDESLQRFDSFTTHHILKILIKTNYSILVCMNSIVRVFFVRLDLFLFLICNLCFLSKAIANENAQVSSQNLPCQSYNYVNMLVSDITSLVKNKNINQ